MSRARRRSLVAASTFTVMLLVLGVGLAWRWTPPPPPQAPGAEVHAGISTGALEARYGIKLDRIAVTAAGGLVELRFTVVDTQKAGRLLKDRKVAPTLIAEDGKTLHAPVQGAWRNIRLQENASCFVLFPNARSAVKPGARVSLAFGDLKVDAVAAL